MSKIDLFLTSIYIHFCSMKDRGRQIVPWFQTCFAIALFFSISITMIFKIIGGSSINRANLPESIFLFIFILIGLITFYLVKHYFFFMDKHLTLSRIYVEMYSLRKRGLIKILSISILVIFPFFCGFVMWLQSR